MRNASRPIAVHEGEEMRREVTNSAQNHPHGNMGSSSGPVVGSGQTRARFEDGQLGPHDRPASSFVLDFLGEGR